MAAKNLMGKFRKTDEPYLTLYDPRTAIRTKVLKVYQVDSTKPLARWFVEATSPMTGPYGDMGDEYVLHSLGGQEAVFGGPRIVPAYSRVRVEQFDPAVIDQVRPALEAVGIAV